MGIFNFFGKKTEQKASAAGVAISGFYANSKISTPRNYETYAKEGYLQNVIAFRCINEIAQAISSVEWLIRDGKGNDIANHPALALIQKPNEMQSWQSFIHAVVSFHLITGNAYVEAATIGDALRDPKELWNLRPDRMVIRAGDKGIPSEYVYEAGQDVIFPVDMMTGASKIHHWKDFHPLNDWYGVGKLEAAGFSIDQHNAAGIFNAALMQNGAKPSSALIFPASKDGESPLSQAQIEAIKVNLDNEYGGVAKAGQTLVLSGGASFSALSITPKDLLIHEGMEKTAQAICHAIGVPIEMILSTGSTFNNKEQSRQMFWENTVIPLLQSIQNGLLNGWLSSFYKDKPQFYYDEENIVALIPRRVERQKSVMELYREGLLTRNEARAELSMDTVQGGDDFKQPMPQTESEILKKNMILTKSAEENAVRIANSIDAPEISISAFERIQALFAKLADFFGVAVLEEIGNDLFFANNERVKAFVRERSAALITQVNETTKELVKRELADALAKGESVKQIQARLKELFLGFNTSRARTIALTEVTQVAGFSALESMKQADIEYVEWLAVMDGEARFTHAHVDGEIVSVGSDFVLKDGDKGKRPGGFSNANNNINCRCAIAASFDGIKRSNVDRRIMWKARDDVRVDAESQFEKLYRQIFNNQLEYLQKQVEDV